MHASGSLYALSSEVVEAVATAKSERFVSYSLLAFIFNQNMGYHYLHIMYIQETQCR